MIETTQPFMGIIVNLANQFSNLTELDSARFSHDDLIAEGLMTLSMLEAEFPGTSEEDMKRYLATFHKQRLLNFIRSTKTQSGEELTYKPRPVEYCEVAADSEEFDGSAVSAHDLFESANMEYKLTEKYISLSDEAKEVVALLVNAPAELLDMATGGVTMQTIKECLNRKHGWTWDKIYIFWESIGLSKSTSSTDC